MRAAAVGCALLGAASMGTLVVGISYEQKVRSLFAHPGLPRRD